MYSLSQHTNHHKINQCFLDHGSLQNEALLQLHQSYVFGIMVDNLAFFEFSNTYEQDKQHIKVGSDTYGMNFDSQKC